MHNIEKIQYICKNKQRMAIIINPFIVAGKIPAKYFCDRKEESKRLIDCIENQENVVLISPRRMGKSKLIDYCFDKSDIRNNYYTLQADILQTTSLQEFIQVLGSVVYKQLARRSEQLFRLFAATLRSLSASFGFDPIQNTPTFDIKLGDITAPEYSLEEIFNYIEKADKRCVIAIDEFQQITNYAEKNVEAILRTRIQRCSNANFIFAGSRRRILNEMFLSNKRPFYQSASLIQLNAIPKETYLKFVKKHFTDGQKDIEKEAVLNVYNTFEGVTYYMQRIMHDCFMEVRSHEVCTETLTKKITQRFVQENDTRLREMMSFISEQQKALLYAICKEGTARQITSASFVRNHNLRSQSSVQSAVKRLLEYDLITGQEHQYRISDPLLSLWIQNER